MYKDRQVAVYFAYHNVRRVVRMVGRVLSAQTTMRNTPFVPSQDQLKNGGWPKGSVRHIMSGDIGNPWNKGI